MEKRLEDTPVCDRVLVVEDESRLRELWQRALAEMGLVGVGARSGEDALVFANRLEFGIAMLDLNLPGINGLDLLSRLREAHPDIAVIIVTGFGTLEAAQRAIHFEVVEFLTKPCSLGELEVAIDRARRRFRERRQPAPAETLPAPSPEPAAASISTMIEIERRTILEALERHGGSRTATAKALGISLRTLYYRLSEYQRQGFIE